jgi:ABC-type transporter Mla subunit MlaD
LLRPDHSVRVLLLENIMRARQGRRAAAGVAIMLIAFLFALVIFFLADLRRAWQDRLTLYAVVPRAPRLRVGSPVWISGHPVGQVRAISFLPVRDSAAPALAVQVEVPGARRSLLRRGSSVRIRSARGIGESVVDIAPGPGTGLPLQEGDTLYAPELLEPRSLSASLHDFQQSLDALLQSTRTLGPRIDQRATQLARLGRQVERVQHEWRALRSNFSNGTVQHALSDSTLLLRLAAIGQSAQQLGPALQSVASRIGDPALQQSFQHLRQHADTVAARLALVRARLAHSTLARFAQDSALLTALYQAQIQLDSLVADTRRNPLRYWLGDRRPRRDERDRSR